jgi:hypothetical protein
LFFKLVLVLMIQVTKIGRLLYGIGLVAVGVHQLFLKEFRPEILPPFPAWPHEYIAFPILAGIALIFSGTMISGLFKTGVPVNDKKPDELQLELAFFVRFFIDVWLEWMFCQGFLRIFSGTGITIQLPGFLSVINEKKFLRPLVIAVARFACAWQSAQHCW